jgi:Holliday junction resolvasome RuvABC endonuclease subunit
VLNPKTLTPGVYKLVGIDPGTVKLGYACLSIDALTNKVVAVSAKTFNAENLPRNDSQTQIHGDRFQRVTSLKIAIRNSLEEDEPLAVISEAPFYSRARPNAFAALMDMLCEVRKAIIEYDCGLPMYLVDPPTVKRSVGAKTSKDKDLVRKAIINNCDLGRLCCDFMDDLDEHAVDAIAVAYSQHLKYQYNTFNRLGEFCGP